MSIRDSLIISYIDTGTSIVAGISIFGVLGNLANTVREDDVSNVIKSGAIGLAFISYPDALVKFPFARPVNSLTFHLVIIANC